MLGSFVCLLVASCGLGTEVPVTDPLIGLSPYNWVKTAEYLQTPNPGAYLMLGFTGTGVSAKFDVSPLAMLNVPASQYPLVRYSIDNGPGTTVQLTAATIELSCGKGLKKGDHTLLLQYISGYVFLDFWTPTNVVRITSFMLDSDGTTNPLRLSARNSLFLGDSITNGDDDTATFKDGITNAVETQDATIGYPSVVASATKSEYGIVAYGGASWDSTAADGHTPGLMNFFSMIDQGHSRLPQGRLNPVPDDIYINVGENSGPSADDVPKLLTALRAASSTQTNIFIIIPFSGRSRGSLSAGFSRYRAKNRSDKRIHVLDLGNNAYLSNNGPTLMSVDGQHPLAILHGQLGAQLVQARAKALAD